MRDFMQKQDPAYQAYKILHVGFILLPLIAGIDKFFNHLTVWSQYMSGPFNILSSSAITMIIAGALEIATGIGMIFQPKVFAYILALWLLAIILNLLTLGQYLDVALRDFGLFLGALALGRLSAVYNR